jgi:hypothetical protein
MRQGTFRPASPMLLHSIDDQVKSARLHHLTLPQTGAISAPHHREKATENSGPVGLDSVIKGVKEGKELLEREIRITRSIVGLGAFRKKYWGILQILRDEPLLNRAGNRRGIVTSARWHSFFNLLGQMGRQLERLEPLSVGLSIAEACENHGLSDYPACAIAGFDRWGASYVVEPVKLGVQIIGSVTSSAGHAAGAIGLKEISEDLKHAASHLEIILHNTDELVNSLLSAENINKVGTAASNAIQNAYQELVAEARPLYRALAHSVTERFQRNARQK